MQTAEIRKMLIEARQDADEEYSDQENHIRVNYPDLPEVLNALRAERKYVYLEFTKRINALAETPA